MQQGPVIKYQTQRGQNTLYLFLSQNSLTIEVINSQTPDKIYYTLISKDSFPQNLINIMDDIQEIYSFLAEPTPQNYTSAFQLPQPSQLVLMVLIKNKVREKSIFLTEKPMPKETLLERNVARLEEQVKRLKIIEGEFRRLKSEQKAESPQQIIQLTNKLDVLKKENEQMRKKIVELRSTVETLKNNGSVTKKEKDKKDEEEQKHVALKEQLKNLQDQNTQLKDQVRRLETDLQTVQFLLQQSNQDYNSSQAIIKQMTLSTMTEYPTIIQPEGSLLSLSFANNYNAMYYIISSKSIQKAMIQTADKQGKFLPASNPIPTTGRHYVNMKLLSASFPLNLKVGLIGRADIQNETYINSGEPDIIMYSSNSGNQLLFEGIPAMEGFPWKVNERLAVLIDHYRKQVQWHLQGQHLYTSPFPQAMKTAQNITFFVQLYNNGDTIQFCNS